MQDITSQEAAAKHKVLQTIGLIPYGKVCTYGVIAEYAGLPRRARYVGTVLKNLPSDSKIPWHRVINSQGKSSFPSGSEKYRLQLAQLIAEGISVSNDKVDLKTFLWRP